MSSTRLVPLDAAGFRPLAAEASQVYGEAMRRSPEVVIQRREVIGLHLGYPGFVAAAAFVDPDEERGPSAEPALVGFGYGYRGAPTQWWHDIVARALGRENARRWLVDGFELAELHVLPAYQSQGIGRRLLRDVRHRAEAAHITLSTPDLETPVDLLRDFYFPGSTEAYAVMGVDL
jgi:GNAT superfamily N-acetyltransferase